MKVKDVIERVATLGDLYNNLKDNIDKSSSNDANKVEIDIDDANAFAQCLLDEIIRIKELEVK